MMLASVSIEFDSGTLCIGPADVDREFGLARQSTEARQGVIAEYFPPGGGLGPAPLPPEITYADSPGTNGTRLTLVADFLGIENFCLQTLKIDQFGQLPPK
jgi:hypothetical protein